MRALLPRELLTTRRRGESVVPLLAEVDEEHLALARDLVTLFASHVGRRRGELSAALVEREQRLGTRFKLVRGLATLLDRRARFEVASKLDPSTARRAVYDAVARLEGGAATRAEARGRVLAAAAGELHVPMADLERALRADVEENLVLVHFDAPDVERLLLRYNLSLVQTLLFDAVRLEVEVERGFRELLSLVKLHGLMFTVHLGEDGRTHVIEIDGPGSAVRETRRYGTAMAKVLPGLARCGRWTLTAQVQERETGKLRSFRATQETLPIQPLAPAVESGADSRPEPDAEDGPSFDSGVERRFAEGWAGLRSGWRLVREPAAIQVEGGEVFLPDFGFAWGDGPVLAYLEVVGFWTPEYLKRKLAKLRRLRDGGPPLLLAVDAALGAGPDAFADVQAEVIPYRGDEVPLVPVVQWLKTLEHEVLADESARVRRAGPVDAATPSVTVAELAAAHGVSVAAVERALSEGLDVGARVRVGEALVLPRVLDELAAELRPGMRVDEVEALARALGILDASTLLTRLGYTVAWSGLDPSAAAIRRRPGA